MDLLHSSGFIKIVIQASNNSIFSFFDPSFYSFVHPIGDNHPNIMGQIECCADDDNIYSVMRFCPGMDSVNILYELSSTVILAKLSVKFSNSFLLTSLN